MTATNEPPLDEIQWSAPQLAAQMQGIHDNSVLHYFAESPFFDRTSNNAVITNQAHFNTDMFPVIQTREAMERHMQGMGGLEFVVAERPRDFGPGAVWVLSKQLRKKRFAFEDEISVLATYFIVGINIYKAPTLSDILSSRIATVCNSLGQVTPGADAVRTWTSSTGHVYRVPSNPEQKPTKPGQSKEGTPMPDALVKPSSESQKVPDSARELERLAEESFAIHLKYGGDYIDENPITGRPGEFHLTSTGRKDKTTAAQAPKAPVVSATTGSKAPEEPKKGSKSPETASAPKPKRRKSKAPGAAAS